jgi:hypothetical protein
MSRALAGLVALALIAGCAPQTATPTPSPALTAPFGRAKLEIVYSALAETHIAMPTSRALLLAALEAIRAEARRTGGVADGGTPEFADVAEPVLADFDRFAAAVGALAAENPQLSPERIAETGMNAMLLVKPDCHAYYTGPGGGFSSLPQKGGAAPARPNADEAGLSYRMFPGGIAYLTWAQFRKTGTYDIHAEVKKALDALLAQGARAWIFDIRANSGGDPPQLMASWFLNGEPLAKVVLRNGDGGTITAVRDLRLPSEYQLPIAVIVNGRGGSSPEHFALYLKETRRATIVGQPTNGCLTSVFPITLQDGTFLSVPANDHVGAITGAHYTNVGVPPDVLASDATAIDVAASLLRDLVAQGKMVP